jgi:hypothetical protein
VISEFALNKNTLRDTPQGIYQLQI